jgi:hypothetical protein
MCSLHSDKMCRPLLSDVVVTPGCTLPLLVCNSRAHWVVEQALTAPPPYTNLIAVVGALLLTEPSSTSKAYSQDTCALMHMHAAMQLQHPTHHGYTRGLVSTSDAMNP